MRRRLGGAVALAALASRLALAADPVPEPPPPAPHRAAAALALGGAYVTWGIAEWFALYQNKPRLPFSVGSEGWFSDTSYAGGADKFGHMWANLTYSRIGTDVLRLGGWDTLPASIASASLSFGFFFLVEVKDGLFHVFSYSDLAGNAAGDLLAIAMENFPALDAALDVPCSGSPASSTGAPATPRSSWRITRASRICSR